MTHQPDPFFALRAAGTAGAIILANEGRHGRPLSYHVVNADGATPEFCCEPHEYLAVVPFAEKHDTLTQRLQQKCVDWGTYWRAPDAHGVILTADQALELLRDALGVEVEIGNG